MELNPIHEDPAMKRKLLLAVETLIGHSARYIEDVGGEVEKSLEDIIELRDKYLMKGGVTQEMIINGSIQAFQKSRVYIMSPPYVDAWLYKKPFALNIGKKYSLNYRTLSDRLMGRLNSEEKLNFERGFHKFALSILKIVAQNHQDEDCELVCDNIIDQINVSLGIAVPTGGGDIFSNFTDILKSDKISGFMNKVTENENVMKHFEDFQEKGIEGLPDILKSVAADKNFINDAKNMMPSEITEKYEEILKKKEKK